MTTAVSASPAASPFVLQVENLKTQFDTSAGVVRAVDGISFSLKRGEVMGLVGESGSGKSITGYSIMRAIDKPGRITDGSIKFCGRDNKVVDLVSLPERQMRDLRGNRVAMILQDPMMSLNPSLRIGTQLTETYLAHKKTSKQEARERAINVMQRVGIPDAERRLSAYPHEFSGGMRQRIAIAIALINEPDVIIADEPTTALDVTTQAQILFEVQKLSREFGTAWIWITHDLTVVAALAQNVAVMYAGKIVEYGSVASILDRPLHPYTKGLIASIPGHNSTLANKRLYQIPGNAPSLLSLPRGCPFRPRCAYADSTCLETPADTKLSENRFYRCWHPVETGAAL